MKWEWMAVMAVTSGLMLGGCGKSSSNGSAQSSSTQKTNTSQSAASSSQKPTVAAGASLYKKSCASCHGASGKGTGKGPRLASPSNVLKRYGTKAQLQKFIAHNMPASNPGSLSTQQAANATEYVWHIAGGK